MALHQPVGGQENKRAFALASPSKTPSTILSPYTGVEVETGGSRQPTSHFVPNTKELSLVQTRINLSSSVYNWQEPL